LIEIGIDPNIATIGPFVIGWHGILMLIGIVAGVSLTFYLAKRNGIPEETILTAAVWAVVAGLIGARLTHVLDNLDTYLNDPLSILALHEGGLGWYGGLIGGILAVLIYARIRKFPLARFADAAGFGVLLGLAIGRIGCTINGDAYGTPTSLPWGLVYTHPDAFATPLVAGHPAPVYEILWIGLVLAVMWWLRGRLRPDGSLFLISVAAYAVGRFLISWVRAEPAVLGPLHQSHLISIGLLAVALILLAYRRVHWVKKEPASEALGEPVPR
jgi:phosphatidylglycerol:prolipoprotein diacylglycerol transferase